MVPSPPSPSMSDDTVNTYWRAFGTVFKILKREYSVIIQKVCVPISDDVAHERT